MKFSSLLACFLPSFSFYWLICGNWSPWDRGLIGAEAAALPHSHGNTGTKMNLQPTPAACSNARSLTHWARPGVESTSSERQCWLLNPLSQNGNSLNWYSLEWHILLTFSRFNKCTHFGNEKTTQFIVIL